MPFHAVPYHSMLARQVLRESPDFGLMASGRIDAVLQLTAAGALVLTTLLVPCWVILTIILLPLSVGT